MVTGGRGALVSVFRVKPNQGRRRLAKKSAAETMGSYSWGKIIGGAVLVVLGALAFGAGVGFLVAGAIPIGAGLTAGGLACLAAGIGFFYRGIQKKNSSTEEVMDSLLEPQDRIQRI